MFCKISANEYHETVIGYAPVVRNHTKNVKKTFRDYQCARRKFAGGMLNGPALYRNCVTRLNSEIFNVKDRFVFRVAKM